MPAAWKYWHVARRAPLDDISKVEESPQIIHSAKHNDDYLEYLMTLWKELPTKRSARVNAEDSLAWASEETKGAFLKRLLDARKENTI